MSDLLNNTTQPRQPFDGDPYKVAAAYLDKIFHLIPTYNGFKLQDIIYSSSDLTDLQKLIAESVHDKMEYILKSEGCLETHSFYGNLTLQLNSHGRDVQSAGGLSAFKMQKPTNISSITNIHQGDNYGQVVQTGHHSSFDFSRDLPNLTPNIQTINSPKRTGGNIAPRILKYIINHIVQIIIGLTIGYLIYRFGWT